METVRRESFVLRYSSLSDVLISGASAVAASCADDSRPDSVCVIPPPILPPWVCAGSCFCSCSDSGADFAVSARKFFSVLTKIIFN